MLILDNLVVFKEPIGYPLIEVRFKIQFVGPTSACTVIVNEPFPNQYLSFRYKVTNSLLGSTSFTNDETLKVQLLDLKTYNVDLPTQIKSVRIESWVDISIFGNPNYLYFNTDLLLVQSDANQNALIQKFLRGVPIPFRFVFAYPSLSLHKLILTTTQDSKFVASANYVITSALSFEFTITPSVGPVLSTKVPSLFQLFNLQKMASTVVVSIRLDKIDYTSGESIFPFEALSNAPSLENEFNLNIVDNPSEVANILNGQAYSFIFKSGAAQTVSFTYRLTMVSRKGFQFYAFRGYSVSDGSVSGAFLFQVVPAEGTLLTTITPSVLSLQNVNALILSNEVNSVKLEKLNGTDVESTEFTLTNAQAISTLLGPNGTYTFTFLTGGQANYRLTLTTSDETEFVAVLSLNVIQSITGLFTFEVVPITTNNLSTNYPSILRITSKDPTVTDSVERIVLQKLNGPTVEFTEFLETDPTKVNSIIDLQDYYFTFQQTALTATEYRLSLSTQSSIFSATVSLQVLDDNAVITLSITPSITSFLSTGYSSILQLSSDTPLFTIINPTSVTLDKLSLDGSSVVFQEFNIVDGPSVTSITTFQNYEFLLREETPVATPYRLSIITSSYTLYVSIQLVVFPTVILNVMGGLLEEGCTMLCSSDGLTYKKTLGQQFTIKCNDVIYGTVGGISKWIAVGESNAGGPSILQSEDGLTWTSQSADSGFVSQFASGIGTVVYCNDQYWIVAGINNTIEPYSVAEILRSEDGKNWTSVNVFDRTFSWATEGSNSRVTGIIFVPQPQNLWILSCYQAIPVLTGPTNISGHPEYYTTLRATYDNFETPLVVFNKNKRISGPNNSDYGNFNNVSNGLAWSINSFTFQTTVIAIGESNNINNSASGPDDYYFYPYSFLLDQNGTNDWVTHRHYLFNQPLIDSLRSKQYSIQSISKSQLSPNLFVSCGPNSINDSGNPNIFQYNLTSTSTLEDDIEVHQSLTQNNLYNAQCVAHDPRRNFFKIVGAVNEEKTLRGYITSPNGIEWEKTQSSATQDNEMVYGFKEAIKLFIRPTLAYFSFEVKPITTSSLSMDYASNFKLLSFDDTRILGTITKISLDRELNDSIYYYFNEFETTDPQEISSILSKNNYSFTFKTVRTVLTTYRLSIQADSVFYASIQTTVGPYYSFQVAPKNGTDLVKDQPTFLTISLAKQRFSQYVNVASITSIRLEHVDPSGLSTLNNEFTETDGPTIASILSNTVPPFNYEFTLQSDSTVSTRYRLTLLTVNEETFYAYQTLTVLPGT